MKLIHIIAVIAIAVGIGILVSASNDMATYSNFKDAFETPGQKFKVVGTLSKDKKMYYDEQKNPNYFTFFMKDNEGEEHKVILRKAKPQDFERSEQIVLTGKVDNNEFIATDMLMKCPSKYKDEEIQMKKAAQGSL
jgi:cytochrome c-type biogenesis protein CcmE